MSSSFEFPELAVPRPAEEQLEAAEARREAELRAAHAGRAAPQDLHLVPDLPEPCSQL